MKKSKMKKKHLKTLSQKMKVFRSSDPILSVLMWGVSHSITDLMHMHSRIMLMPDDFRAFTKIKVENQNFNKENMPSNFKFKEYCPLVFRNLRHRFGIGDQEYLDSVTKGEPLPKENAGRSGAKFYLTSDKKFFIKIVLTDEQEKMQSLLKSYHQHIVETKAKTLFPQYVGMYRLTVSNTEYHIVVMRNVFSQKWKIHKKYDLKGSTVEREASEKEKQKSLPTFKDNDFVNMGEKIYMGDEQKNELFEIVKKDVEYLEKHNLIDYSLLVGIHDVEKGGYASGYESECSETEESAEESPSSPVASTTPALANESKEGATPASSGNAEQRKSSDQEGGDVGPGVDIYRWDSSADAPGQYLYFIAIIDVLTYYGVKKATAQAAKTVKYGANAEISTVRPEHYSKRFVEFLESIFL